MGKYSHPISVIVLLFTNILITRSLHLSVNQNAQLQYLISLQQNYQSQFRSLDQEANTLQAKINSASNLDQQIKVLEQAVQKQRQSLSSIKYNLMSSSLEPFIQCQVIPDQQKQQYLQKIQSIVQPIEELNQVLDSIPQCDEKDGIQTQISKIQKYLKRIETIINNNCEHILSQAQHTYQSNLQAQNWIIGEGKTMQDVIESYFNRAQQKSNITNCPIQTPYYDGFSCVNCTQQRPIFDISRKICMICPENQQLNKTTKQCQITPKNSNYQIGTNYVLKPLKLLPLPIQNQTYCQDERPFFNGKQCISCPLPNHYWNISQSKCRQCDTGLIFNQNNHKCTQRQYNKLTRISGTNWVTDDGNVTKVLQDHSKILSINKTTGQYTYCPKLQPYFDDISCIYCENQFNLDTKKCTQAPQGLQYDKNMRKYLVPESQKQTDIDAQNYIASLAPLNDNPDIQNCNQTHPFYDQVSCIYCQKPFVIFNYDTNTCVTCDPTQVYNQTSHKCEQRPAVFVKGNQTNLMATQSVSIQDYKTNLYNSINQNNDKIPLQCQNESQYAAIQSCVGCNIQKGEFFNVQTYKCQFCDGQIDNETRICHERTYYLTNLDAQNILAQNLTQAKANQSKILEQLQRRQVCPSQTPFQYKNQTGCHTCSDQNPVFDYQSKSCTKCPEKTQYDKNYSKCRRIVYLTNLTAQVLVEDPDTIQKYINQQQKINQTNITQMCPQNYPYTADNKLCLKCQDNFPLFNLTSGLCTKCPASTKYFHSKHKCLVVNYLTNLTADGLLQHDNYTVENVKIAQELIKQSDKMFQQCPEDKPYGSIDGCIMCLGDHLYFDLQSKVCTRCPLGTRYWVLQRKCKNITIVTNITAAQKLIQDNQFTFQRLKSQIAVLRKQGPVDQCPQDKPYKDKKQCISCPEEEPYFFYRTLNCSKCDNFNQEKNTCPPKPPKYPNMTNYKWVAYEKSPDEIITEYLKLRKYPNATQCYAFYNPITKDCINCTDGEYFNADIYQCQQCAYNTQFDINIHKCVQKQNNHQFTNLQGSFSGYLIYGGLTLGELEARIQQKKSQYPQSTYCSDQKPYYDNFGCISCPKYKPYFNLRYQLCQVCLENQTFNIQTHNCQDTTGQAIWRKPNGQLVYPYLFG